MKMLSRDISESTLHTFLFGLIFLTVVTMGAGEQQSKLQANEEMCYQKMAAATYTDGLYCNITWDRVMCWDRTPAGSIARQPCADYINTFDTAQFATRECLSNGTWQPNPNPNMTIGYTDYTACLTKHSVENIQDHISRIQLITDIGYGISLASLIIAELIMIFSKRLHCKSNTLHINLFFAFILRAAISLIQNVSFVQGLGFEKDIIRKPGGGVVFNTEGIHWECKLLMTLFIYALTASQMWIFVEGLYLHMLVYRTLFTERHGIRLYVFLGWGLPLIYLIPWILVRIFVDDMFCWTLYKEKYFVWIIKAPIVLSVLVNSFFFVSIVLVLCRRVKFHRYPKGSSQHFRKIAKFAIVLIPLFGVIYLVFAPFPTDVYPNADMIMLYCEMFYNSIQGFILATLFCFLNEEVQNQIRWWCYQRRQDGHHTRTMFMSSMRKSTNHSRTLMSRDPNMAGGAVYMNGGRNGETKLKWTTSRRSSSKTDQRNDTLKDTAYNRVICQDVDGSTCTIDTV